MAQKINSTRPRVKPGARTRRPRLAAILAGDNVAIINTNLRLQAGIRQDRIRR